MSDPKNVPVDLSRRARKDLDTLLESELRIIVEDIHRIAERTFPGEIKMISSLPSRPLQADSGRFRILFRWNQSILEIITVFPKKDQTKTFRSLK